MLPACGGDLERRARDDRRCRSASRPGDLLRVVREEPHALDAEVAQDLRADAVVAQVLAEAELEVRLDRVAAAGPAARRRGSCSRGRCRAPPGGGRRARRGPSAAISSSACAELVAAVAALRAEDVAGEALGVEPHEHVVAAADVAQHERHVLVLVDRCCRRRSRGSVGPSCHRQHRPRRRAATSESERSRMWMTSVTVTTRQVVLAPRAPRARPRRRGRRRGRAPRRAPPRRRRRASRTRSLAASGTRRPHERAAGRELDRRHVPRHHEVGRRGVARHRGADRRRAVGGADAGRDAAPRLDRRAVETCAAAQRPDVMSGMPSWRMRSRVSVETDEAAAVGREEVDRRRASRVPPRRRATASRRLGRIVDHAARRRRRAGARDVARPASIAAIGRNLPRAATSEAKGAAADRRDRAGDEHVVAGPFGGDVDDAHGIGGAIDAPSGPTGRHAVRRRAAPARRTTTIRSTTPGAQHRRGHGAAALDEQRRDAARARARERRPRTATRPRRPGSRTTSTPRRRSAATRRAAPPAARRPTSGRRMPSTRARGGSVEPRPGEHDADRVAPARGAGR